MVNEVYVYNLAADFLRRGFLKKEIFMKIQLALLLVVLFVSLPSVVFSQPPLGAVQSGETSQTAPTAETVKKSWKGPLFGFGLGLGVGDLSVDTFGFEEESGIFSVLPVKVRLGYGLSDSAVLYGVVGSDRAFASGEWLTPYVALGMMFRRRWDSRYYGFVALGSSFEDDLLGSYLTLRGGSGIEVHPSLSVEFTGHIKVWQIDSVFITGSILDITFNYHFY